MSPSGILSHIFSHVYCIIICSTIVDIFPVNFFMSVREITPKENTSFFWMEMSNFSHRYIIDNGKRQKRFCAAYICSCAAKYSVEFYMFLDLLIKIFQNFLICYPGFAVPLVTTVKFLQFQIYVIIGIKNQNIIFKYI